MLRSLGLLQKCWRRQLLTPRHVACPAMHDWADQEEGTGPSRATPFLLGGVAPQRPEQDDGEGGEVLERVEQLAAGAGVGPDAHALDQAPGVGRRQAQRRQPRRPAALRERASPSRGRFNAQPPAQCAATPLLSRRVYAV